jgi:hypothetical protein
MEEMEAKQQQRLNSIEEANEKKREMSQNKRFQKEERLK